MTTPFSESAFWSTAPWGRRSTRVAVIAVIALVLATMQLFNVARPAKAAGPCGPPVVSVIACENSQPGTPSSDWDITGSGSTTIQGFATSMSVQPGDTVKFKINTPSTNYHFDVLRLGYYQGNGARKVAAGLKPSVTLPQTQPPCLTATDSTGLIDCGNWAVSASWTVPTTAVSGVYIVHLVRDDAVAESHITFVVRNDASHSDLLFQTSDETWQAYNSYGQNSLYQCSVNCPPGSPAAYKGASKVSYNRPFHSADDDQGRSWILYAEYRMIRWLERNGYDVSYTSGLDVGTSAGGALLTNHKTFMSVGHDEYWSGTQRANVEAARDKGVNLAFFSGNEVFWKTRWEPSIDGTNTPNRTLVTYKETHYDDVVDPQDPPTWTGTWQDPRFSPPGDGGRPQNALTGQLFVVNSGTTDIKVPAAYSKLRFWRNTTVASLTSGQTATLGSGLGTLGYEWDTEPDNGFRPTGLWDLSSTTSTTAEVFTDYGSTTVTNGTATHRMSLYKAPSGALVFGAGTVQWAFGLDDPNGSTGDKNMQQATVNLFADMGAQPYALMTGLTVATASTDTSAPSSAITSPTNGSNVGDGSKITISGTATDAGGGVVAGVEVSTDGGSTWHPATGTTSWTYSWIAHGNPSTTLKTRAVDDSGNLESPSAGVSVNVGCTCSIWGLNVTPTKADSGSATATEVGIKFKSDASGSITGIRYYKASTNTGTHVGSLWSATGTKLASATFTGETTTGWQQVTFATPVTINANTTYVASYFAPVGHTAQDDNYLYPNPSPTPDAYSRADAAPLHVLRNTNGVQNGVFRTGSTGFPTSSTSARNYWVDVMFSPSTGPATAPGAPTSVTATPGNASAVVTWQAPGDGGKPISSYTVTPYIGTTAQPSTTVSGSPPDNSAAIPSLTNGTAYTFRVSATNSVGTGPTATSNSVTPVAINCNPCSLWPSTAKAIGPDGDTGAIQVGDKFKSDVNGSITGIRFYKSSSASTGTKVVNLWDASGNRLASATVTNETATGWQQASFASPVNIIAGTIYVASYFAPSGRYSTDGAYFAGTGVDNAPLHAPADGTAAGGQGVYAYGTSSTFPNNTFNSENYWVDVLFSTVPASATAPSAPTGVSATAGNGSATVNWTAPSDGGSPITSYTVTPYIGSTAQATTTVSGSPPATTATITGLTNGTAYTFKVSATNAVGTGSASAASNAVTPTQAPTAPAAPTGVSANPSDGSASVTWTAPSDGGSAITSYTVTPYIGSTAQATTTVSGSPPATSATVTGLTNGTAYTFTVSATNAIGTGAASAASNAVTPTASPTAPTAPTAVTATAGNASATVSWTAPSDGGSPITSYTVTPYIGSNAQATTTVSGSPPATSTTVSGLANGTGYTFTVTATNAIGTGAASTASNSVTPQGATAPGTPSSVSASPGDTSAVVNWTAPSDGGSPITSYTVTPFIGSTAQATTTVSGSPPATTTTVTGLTNGTAYTFTVTGTNAVGTGTASAASSPVTPATTPSAPTGATATAGDASATVSWTAPSDGGSAITSYVVTPYVGTTSQTPATVSGSPPATTTTITGLTNGTAYTFRVSANNAVGTGPASAATSAVTPAVTGCSACTLWPPSATPTVPENSDSSSVELGLKFSSDVSGTITGIRFYKGAGNTGTHVGNLWTSTGTNLATATFTGESATGWQQVSFTSPVAITAGTMYVASYFAPVGEYAGDGGYFASSDLQTGPLNALQDGVSGGNGVFSYAASSTFPTNSFNATNYWVDVVFASGASTAPAAPTGVTATAGNTQATVSWTAPSDGGSAITSYTVTPFIGATAQSPVTVTGNPPATSTTVTGLTNGTAYTFKVTATNAVGTGPASAASSAVTPSPPSAPGAPTGVTATAGNASATVSWTAPSDGGSPITSYTVTPFIGATAQATTTVNGSPPATTATVSGLTNGTAYTFKVTATNAAGTGPASAASGSVTPAASGCSGCTIWPSTATPTNPSANDSSGVTLGVRFKADVNGSVTGVRFYKGSGNTGTHVGNLWSSTGTKLATATFSGESTTGWQQVTFTTPVAITAGTVYVASYFAPVGHYAGDGGYFATAGVDSGPLHALQDGVSGANGLYAYGSAATFPSGSFNSSNYWVDVVFAVAAATAPAAPTGVTATAGNTQASVNWTTPSDGGSPITSYTVTPYIGSTAQTPVTVSGSPPATSATVTGLTNGTAYTFKVAATNAVGTGPASAASNSVTPNPPTAPGAPTGVAATAGNAQATVSWTAPSDGGSAITSYTVTPYIGTTAQGATTVSGTPPATSATVRGLTNGTAYTFRVSATNAVGTGAASAASNSITPASTTCTGCTIWGSTATPANPNIADSSGVTLGVKFKVDVNGSITGLRFYKGAGNTGTHVGNLWSSTGTKLATATFTGETSSGWQQVTFSSPVAVTAGTVYVASYFAPAGHYAGDGGYFTTAGVDNGSLHALQDGVSGGNGVYRYGTAAAFPNSTYNATNYWIDVFFTSS